MPRLSVIVPVYNGERFIKSCLRSIERQEQDDCQIILINDNSADGSREIIEKYKKNSKYEIIIYNNDENRGSGRARNQGLDLAAGDYVLFVDQDDIIAGDYFSTLIKLIEEKQADAVFTGYLTMTEKRRIISRVALSDNSWSMFMNITPWGKIFKRKFLNDNGIRFAPLGIGEDIFMIVSCMAKASNIAISDYVGYYWRQNRQSFSHTAHERVGAASDLVPLFDRLLSIDDSRGLFSGTDFEYFLIKTAVYQILKTTGGASLPEILENERRLHSWLREHYPGYTRNENLSFGRPKGERAAIAAVVRIYMMLYRAGLSGVLLRLLSLRGARGQHV